MKTISSAEPTGKTCPPRRIPLSETMTARKLQDAYDEIADQYEKRFGLTSTSLAWRGSGRNCCQKQLAKSWMWHVERD